MSLPEVLLWDQLRASRAGFKVRRQHPLGPYVADFYVREARLAIEIDGAGAHDGEEQGQRGERRDRWLQDNGFGVLHLPASAILENMEGVLQMIAARVASPLHQPAAGPPPLAREEQA
jgi:very-short-patch-repair endonuclease